MYISIEGIGLLLALYAIAIWYSYRQGFLEGNHVGGSIGIELAFQFVKSKVGKEQVDFWIEKDLFNFQSWVRKMEQDKE